MFELIRKNILSPLVTRIGTAVSLGLTGYGLADGDATVVGSAVAIGLGLGIDLLSDWLRKRAIVNQATGNAS